jgi:hypothetical protein
VKFDEGHEIYDMYLHTTIHRYLGGLTYEILRVHGGWIYTTKGNDGTLAGSVFVPYTESEAENEINS